MPSQYRSPHVRTAAVPAARRRLTVAARVLGGIVMLGALAAMFVPVDPDPVVVLWFAAPSLALAMLSNHLDGRSLLTGDPPKQPQHAVDRSERRLVAH